MGKYHIHTCKWKKM